jgi:hypothetical protein
MKKTYKSIVAVVALSLAVTFITGCKKSDTTDNGGDPLPKTGCPTCSATPSAVAANNTSSKGVYKGVIVGSTGTIKFDIANGGTTITGTLVLDGVTINLTTTGTVTAGSAFSATFTGTLNGSAVSIKFSVDADGKNPIITLPVIPGHPTVLISVLKELSTAQIEAYEGTYSSTKPETGTFNFVVNRTGGVWSVVHRASGSTEIKGEAGTIVGSNLLDADHHVLATLSRNSAGIDIISGMFTGGNGVEVTTITGTRTM